MMNYDRDCCDGVHIVVGIVALKVKRSERERKARHRRLHVKI